ncbi:MAG TPA: hypothetical protein VK875_04340 [Euzebyales bacterium]|nr:hypothetical protein [Euzebyales bacterium]
MTDDERGALALLAIRGIALARIGIGVVATLAPGVGARFQFGSAAPELAVTVRMLGARDLGLGLGALLAERHGSAALRGWAEAGALADAVDAVAFLRSGRPAGIRAPRLTTLVAASSAVCSVWAARRLTG